MKLSIEALDDIDVFSFIEILEDEFPGYVQFQSVDIKRNAELDTDTLKKIGAGTPVSLVKADVNFLWHSVPETKKDDTVEE